MEETTDEIQHLQACINDLISVLAIPAVWSGREPRRFQYSARCTATYTASDFAYARLKDPLGGVPIEVAKFAECRNLTPLPQEIGQALDPWLENDPKEWPLLIRNPIGEGDVSIVPLRLGLQERIGIIIAGSQRADFPVESERLLLRIAANQAVICLQEARAHDKLEALVAARTGELARANESLHRSETYFAEARRLSHTGRLGHLTSATREIVHWSAGKLPHNSAIDHGRWEPSFKTTLCSGFIPTMSQRAGRIDGREIRSRGRSYEQRFKNCFSRRQCRATSTIWCILLSTLRPAILLSVVGTVMDGPKSKPAQEALRQIAGRVGSYGTGHDYGRAGGLHCSRSNQPLASVVNSASACLRWLDAQKLEEARRSASRAIAEGHSVSEIVGRIRALAKKAPPQKEWLDVNETIHEVIALARGEIQGNGIALETELSENVLPVILADRIELQQVILNLMMNAIEAMSGVGGVRETFGSVRHRWIRVGRDVSAGLWTGD